MQPTAQAVGEIELGNQAPEERKKPLLNREHDERTRVLTISRSKRALLPVLRDFRLRAAQLGPIGMLPAVAILQ